MSLNPIRNSRRRVVVTGIGAVSPNGVGREAFWANTLNGVSGVRAIDQFDTSALQVRIAGIVGERFRESDWVNAKERPHVGRVTPLARAAAGEALQDAGIDTAA
ncbi:MAG: beta-ketoacyl synthase, partial [Acidobacteria bacterium]|nr:beta-ketoacyl synthase [Acidobacteriota bacterium]